MFLYHEIIFNDTPFPFQMSLLYLFSPPWLKHAFSLTFSTAVCFWWLPTSENNYSLGLFLSRFNGKMSFYQLLDIKNNSPQKMICSLRSVRIQLFLRRKTEDYLFDSPPPLKNNNIMATYFHSLSHYIVQKSLLENMSLQFILFYLRWWAW